MPANGHLGAVNVFVGNAEIIQIQLESNAGKVQLELIVEEDCAF